MHEIDRAAGNEESAKKDRTRTQRRASSFELCASQPFHSVLRQRGDANLPLSVKSVLFRVKSDFDEHSPGCYTNVRETFHPCCLLSMKYFVETCAKPLDPPSRMKLRPFHTSIFLSSIKRRWNLNTRNDRIVLVSNEPRKVTAVSTDRDCPWHDSESSINIAGG